MRTIGRFCVILFVLLLVLILPEGLQAGLAQEPPGQISAVTLEQGAPVERAMVAGDVHAYQVTLDQGQFLRAIVEQRGIDVVVTVISPEGEKISEVDSPTGTEGSETVEVAAATSGSYRLEIRPWEEEGAAPPEAGRYEVRIDRLLSATEYAEQLAAEGAKIEAVKQWLADHAIPLRTVEAGHGFEDMQPLKEIVGNARVVALGEATHGSREFFQLKHRMLEFLVSEMGFTVFAIEATMPEAFDINEYVLTGDGDPAKALAGLYFWTWNTEEVLDLIEWMREYNADPRHSRKVKFYGFDVQSAPRAVRVTLDYLRLVDPVEARAAERQLAVLANPYTEEKFVTLSQEERESAASTVRAVLRRFDDRRVEYVSRTDSTAWALARQHARIAAQNIEIKFRFETPNGFLARDSVMAENVRWILDHEGPEAKVVIWAHNGHVSTGPGWMGAHLREALGTDMVVFGFAFNQGSFQAIEMPMPLMGGLRSFTLSPAPDGSLDGMLAAAGLRLAAIDLRKLPSDGPVAEWWSVPHQTRSIGSGYSREFGFWASQNVNQLYDALLFVESTTSARPNPGGRRVSRALLGAPVNLDFEDGELGEPPAGWFMGPPQGAFDHVIETLRDFDFDLTTSDDRPYRGEQSAMISRPHGRHYGEA
ncbi:MAG TPA: erythromycin esterase family protein, partial [Gemmatimonadota bacterium]|nr:erythromycin esterase family protein [Gemmatimonadota bacterium]